MLSILFTGFNFNKEQTRNCQKDLSCFELISGFSAVTESMKRSPDETQALAAAVQITPQGRLKVSPGALEDGLSRHLRAFHALTRLQTLYGPCRLLRKALKELRKTM